MFGAGIILTIEVSIYIFVQWGWFMPFCSDDFPRQYKSCVNALSVSSWFILAAEQTNIKMRRAHSIFGPLFSLEDHSFIIYSFLLDQLVLEISSWMLNSCSNIRNCFLPFVRLTVQGFSLKLSSKFLELINILVHSFCYIIAEGFRFMPLSLVRLRTFRLSTWVS